MNLLLKIRLDEKKSIIKDLIGSKTVKFKKFLDENTKISWNYFTENGLYFSEVKITGFNGPAIMARASSNREYKVIDDAAYKIQVQLNKRFGQKSHRSTKIDHRSYLE
jgi:ribosome-associated translation inhibitor RaiA